uniref:Centrin-3 n=1 Tax=Sphaerodactylus townsendi TaxID=933632 RepID=A0ACB8EPW6_9SAUR
MILYSVFFGSPQIHKHIHTYCPCRSLLQHCVKISISLYVLKLKRCCISVFPQKVAMRALGFDVKKADVLKILKDYDRAGTGKITFEDFNEVVTDWILDRDPHEEILKAFKLFDDDDSGKISLRNLRRVARELGENMTDEELRAMIEEFDKDGDGEINQEEFIAIMTGDI